jgi:magnesium-transporting ATPase (P-type)
VIAPLLATQILWVNLLTDSLPGLALGVDPAESWLMKRPPRGRNDPVLDTKMWWAVGLVGVTMGVVTLFMLDLRLAGGMLGGSGDIAEARTGAFTVLVFAQLVNSFCSRSSTRSVFSGHGSNPWLWGAVGVCVLLQVAVVYIPLLNEAMGTAPMSWDDWAIAVALSSSILWVTEIQKWFLRRRMGS